ncbi:MAG: tetratricopeptide repeat protein [Vitreoscilla sp.]|nr:tetratricopeptide repeat protein [Vitreoscilla sp.]
MTDTIADLKQQLRHLEALAASGALPEDAARTAREDLQRRLVAAVLAAPDATAAAPAPAAMSAPPVKHSPRLIAGLAGFAVLFAIGGYAWLGNAEGMKTAPASGPMAAAVPADDAASSAHPMTMGRIEGMVASLAERLKSRPDDAEGWLMLGRSQAVLGKFDLAIPAYRKVLALQPKNAQALADLADALAMTQGQRFDGEPAKLVTQALAAEPDNLKALSIAGTIAFDKKDYTAAAGHWERVVKVASSRGDMADSDLAKQARANLDEARQLAGLPPLAPSAPSTVSTSPVAATPAANPLTAGRESVTGRVELSPALAARAAPDDTVFIFARPAAGARMPLAILKKRVRDLPADFTLDDSMAMSPAAKLSGASQVVVGARVSKSGQAMPQPGDLEGLSAAVAPGQQGLKIVIAEVVK